MTAKGTRGETYELVLEYIQDHPGHGYRDIVEYSGLKGSTIASILGRMKNEDKTITQSQQGGYYPVQQKSNPPIQSGASTNTTEKVSLALQQRKSHAVDIYTSVIHRPNVIKVAVHLDNQWVEYPVWGDLKISLGPEDPCWEGEVANRGISEVKIWLEPAVNGASEVEVYPTDRGAVIAIALL
jgi:hypothetical protein